MIKYEFIGNIETKLLNSEFGELITDELILTEERDKHIMLRHSDDYVFFHKNVHKVIKFPDLILADRKNENTVFYVKNMDESNLNIVIKLSLETNNLNRKNSIITAYRLGEKSLKKVVKKNKTLYKVK